MKNHPRFILIASLLLFICSSEQAFGDPPPFDESKLQWGPEVNGVSIALRLVAVPDPTDMKSFPTDVKCFWPGWDAKWWPATIVFYVKNSGDKTVVADVWNGGLEVTFFSLNEHGKATQIEDDTTRGRHEAGSGAFLVVKPGETVTMKAVFPIDLLTQIKASLVANVAFLISGEPQPQPAFLRVLSVPVDIKQLKTAFLNSYSTDPFSTPSTDAVGPVPANDRVLKELHWGAEVAGVSMALLVENQNRPMSDAHPIRAKIYIRNLGAPTIRLLDIGMAWHPYGIDFFTKNQNGEIIKIDQKAPAGTDGLSSYEVLHASVTKIPQNATYVLPTVLPAEILNAAKGTLFTGITVAGANDSPPNLIYSNEVSTPWTTFAPAATPAATSATPAK